MTDRACTGTNANGGPCRANPLRPGTVIADVTVTGEWCLSHDPNLPDSARIQGPQPGAGRPRKPRPADIARQLLEEHELAAQRPYWRTLGYDVVIDADGPRLVKLEGGGAKLFGVWEGRVKMSEHDDLAAMIQAAEKLQDRVYGRPTQATEISGPDQAPIEFLDVFDPEVRRLTKELLLRSSGLYDQDPEGSEQLLSRLDDGRPSDT